MKIQQILEKLSKRNVEYQYLGNMDLDINGFSVSERIKRNTIVMFQDIQYVYQMLELDMKDAEKVFFILPKESINILYGIDRYHCLLTEKVEEIFFYVINDILNPREIKKGISETARVRTKNIGTDVFIGENSYIEENVIIGDNVVIQNNVSILGKVKIDDFVHIKSGAVIGEEGYQYIKDKLGNLYKFKSDGGVQIGKFVEIGSNTCIDRGVVDDTIIEENVKISNLCQIAHDIKIKKNTLVTAKVSIAAYATIGSNCFIGSGTSIKDRVNIGNDVFIGLGSVVKNDIVNKETVFGYPAVSYERQKKIVSINNLNKSFSNKGTKQVKQTLDNITFDIRKNEFISILGPSGCGKSTLLRILAGLSELDSGNIDKKNIELSMVFQEDALMPWMTVGKNVGLGLKLKKYDRKEIDNRVNWALELVGLEKYKKYYPYQLSGGMKKRVAIARCLVLKSPLVLMDEPFSALDIVTKTGIQEDLSILRKKEQFAVCMVTHDIEEAIYLSDRILIVSGEPAKVDEIVQINLDYPRDRESKRFIELKKVVTDIVSSK